MHVLIAFFLGPIGRYVGLALLAFSGGAILAMPPVAAMPTCQYHALALGRPAHTHCPECGQELPALLQRIQQG
jgi:hypothetical protein